MLFVSQPVSISPILIHIVSIGGEIRVPKKMKHELFSNEVYEVKTGKNYSD